MNENAKGLLHKLLPPGTDLSGQTQRQTDTVARRFNTRSRQAPGWKTPEGAFAHAVASTGRIRQINFWGRGASPLVPRTDAPAYTETLVGINALRMAKSSQETLP